MKTIMNTRKGVCYACGRIGFTQEHHIFYGTANRKLSEKYGLKVYLCPDCHMISGSSVHGGNRKLDRSLKEDGQRTFEMQPGGSRNRFVRTFGENYLEESDAGYKTTE